MTVLSPASWAQYGSYDARNDRLHVSSLLNSQGATTTAAFTVAQSVVASMVLTVGSGAAYIDGSWASTQGYYCFINDAPITVTVQPSDATFPRIDRVVARVYDSQYAGMENKAQIEIVKGDPAVSPAIPALPAGSIELARISVAANVSTIINANINNTVMPLASFRESLVVQSLNSVPWTAYTPTYTNFTVGTSSVTARYIKLGKTVYYAGIVTLASGFAMNASPVTISLPYPLFGAHTSGGMGLGASVLNDASAATLIGQATPASSTSFYLRNAAGTAITNVVPFTWVVTDSFSWNMTYETSS